MAGCESSGGASVVVLSVCEDLGHVCLRPVPEPARHVVEREAEVEKFLSNADAGRQQAPPLKCTTKGSKMSTPSLSLPGGTWTLGDLTVTRFGYGAMQLAGPWVMGPPADREGTLAVLREAVNLGVTTSTPATPTGRGSPTSWSPRHCTPIQSRCTS